MAFIRKLLFKRKKPYQEGDQSLQGLRIFFFVSSVTPKIYYTIRLWLNEAMIYHLKQGTRPVLISGSRLITPFIVFPCYSSVRQLNRGGSINYREEEKKILDFFWSLGLPWQRCDTTSILSRNKKSCLKK